MRLLKAIALVLAIYGLSQIFGTQGFERSVYFGMFGAGMLSFYLLNMEFMEDSLDTPGVDGFLPILYSVSAGAIWLIGAFTFPLAMSNDFLMILIANAFGICATLIGFAGIAAILATIKPQDIVQRILSTRKANLNYEGAVLRLKHKIGDDGELKLVIDAGGTEIQLTEEQTQTLHTK